MNTFSQTIVRYKAQVETVFELPMKVRLSGPREDSKSNLYVCSHEGEIIDLAVDADVIEKSGAWFAYNGEKLGQGKENVKLLLKEKPELCAEIEKKVREFYDIDLDNEKKDE